MTPVARANDLLGPRPNFSPDFHSLLDQADPQNRGLNLAAGGVALTRRADPIPSVALDWGAQRDGNPAPAVGQSTVANFSNLPPSAVRFPLAWSNGAGSYRWNSAQVAIRPDGSEVPTGNDGGSGVITTTNPNGIATTDATNPRTGQIDRTYYDATTGKMLGTFPVVPGQSVLLDNGRTSVTYGLPQSPPPDSKVSLQPEVSSAGDGINNLAVQQRQFADIAEQADPLVWSYRSLDKWAHRMAVPRSIDYLTPLDPLSPNDFYNQILSINANIPEARGTRPATANDIINAESTLLSIAPMFKAARGTAEVAPVIESLDVLAGRGAGLSLDTIPLAEDESYRLGPHKRLVGELKGTGLQAHHLNQNAAFQGHIPGPEGISLGMRGNAFTDIGSPHYEFHSQLEDFWRDYRNGGVIFGAKPTNAQYGEALEAALVRAGRPQSQARYIAEEAAAQRAAFGLAPEAEVPKIPKPFRGIKPK